MTFTGIVQQILSSPIMQQVEAEGVAAAMSFFQKVLTDVIQNLSTPTPSQVHATVEAHWAARRPA